MNRSAPAQTDGPSGSEETFRAPRKRDLTPREALSFVLADIANVGGRGLASAEFHADLIIQQLAARGYAVTLTRRIGIRYYSPSDLRAMRHALGVPAGLVAREAGVHVRTVRCAERLGSRTLPTKVQAIGVALERLEAERRRTMVP